MEVYQLRLLELGIMTEEVFKNKNLAINYINKHKGRSLEIKSKYLEKDADYVFRLLSNDYFGECIRDEIYSSYEEALLNKKDDERVIKESLIVDSLSNYYIEEVAI